ncbi:hypothetical protein ACOSQ4_018915 [Xanthoceras sorbifolium]
MAGVFIFLAQSKPVSMEELKEKPPYINLSSKRARVDSGENVEGVREKLMIGEGDITIEEDPNRIDMKLSDELKSQLYKSMVKCPDSENYGSFSHLELHASEVETKIVVDWVVTTY